MRPARLTVGNDSESDYASIPWDFGSIGNDGRQGKRRGGQDIVSDRFRPPTGLLSQVSRRVAHKANDNNPA